MAEAAEVQRIKVRWHDGAYQVNTPNWEGDEVVSAAAYDELKLKLEEAQAANECDRSKLCVALKDITEALRMREWLGSGRGCYEYDDDRWYKEFSAAWNEIHTAIDGLRTLAASWSSCLPVGSKGIADARIDLKKRIEELTQALVVCVVQRDAWINYAFAGDLDPSLVPVRHLKLPAGETRNKTAIEKLAEERNKLREECALADREVKCILDSIPNAVRIHEGGGPENIYASLAVSVARMMRESGIKPRSLQEIPKNAEAK